MPYLSLILLFLVSCAAETEVEPELEMPVVVPLSHQTMESYIAILPSILEFSAEFHNNNPEEFETTDNSAFYRAIYQSDLQEDLQEMGFSNAEEFEVFYESLVAAYLLASSQENWAEIEQSYEQFRDSASEVTLEAARQSNNEILQQRLRDFNAQYYILSNTLLVRNYLDVINEISY